MLDQGTILDNKYRIESVIDRGGFGYLYRAQDTITGETVAIKELIPSRVGDPRAVRRFVQEARATLRLTHPHIARTYGVFRQDDTYYLSMEYLAGGSLAQRLEHGPLPVAEALRIAAELCDALSYAHRQGVVHCDVKPGNVLFDAEGGAHLADFGIAHVSGPGITQPLPGPRKVVGTLQYMPPEQLDGVRTDPRIDVYALGALLYEMLSGRSYLDFEDDASPDAQVRNAQRIRHDTPRPLGATEGREYSSADAGLPEGLSGLVDRALSKVPDERFATAAEMCQALQAYRQVAQPSPRITVALHPPAAKGSEYPPSPPVAPIWRAGQGDDRLPPRTAPLPRPRAAPQPGQKDRRPLQTRRSLWEWLIMGGLALLALAVVAGLSAALAGIRLTRDGAGPDTPTAMAQVTTLPGAAPGATEGTRPEGTRESGATPTGESGDSPTPGTLPPAGEPSPVPSNTPDPLGDDIAREQELLSQVPTRPGSPPVIARRAAQPPTIDGNLDEWGGREYAIDQVVHQEQGGEWTGPGDLGGTFRAAWDDQYLYLALRVQDDWHVQTQEPRTMYKGDDVEIQIDTDLAGDFDDASLGGDDGQLGLSAHDLAAGPYAAYVWRPPEREGPIDIPMAFRPVDGGYLLEAAIPWSALNLSPQSRAAYGLAVSLSDADVPGYTAQETMVSNAPNRIWENPTTWGTLVLADWN